MVESKIFSKPRIFSDESCVNRTETVHGTLHFLFLLSPIVWNMCENLHYESLYFKELHNNQEYYWPTICRAGTAVVSSITSISLNNINIIHEILQGLKAGSGQPNWSWRSLWVYITLTMDKDILYFVAMFFTNGVNKTNWKKYIFLRV